MLRVESVQVPSSGEQIEAASASDVSDAEAWGALELAPTEFHHPEQERQLRHRTPTGSRPTARTKVPHAAVAGRAAGKIVRFVPRASDDADGGQNRHFRPHGANGRWADVAAPFSSEEDGFIIEQYPKTTLLCIAAALGRKPAQVSRRVGRLVKDGRLDPDTRFYPPRWTAEEDWLLIEKWGLVADGYLVRLLARSRSACVNRARRLGIKRKDNFLSLEEIGRIMGVDPHKVRDWIYYGHLDGRRGPFLIGKNRIWIVTPEALEEFIKLHPQLYDRQRIHSEEYSYWRSLADRWVLVGESGDEAAAFQRPRPYTPEEDSTIVKNYVLLGAAELARQLDRPESSVRRRVEKLRAKGVQVGYRQRGLLCPRKWNATEDMFLRENWGLLPDDDVAFVLERSVGTCEARATQLGFTRGSNRRKHSFLTAARVRTIFGVQHCTVKEWLAQGWLKGQFGRSQKKEPGKRNLSYRAWQISEADLETFIQEHTERYDLERMPAKQGRWRAVAVAAHIAAQAKAHATITAGPTAKKVKIRFHVPKPPPTRNTYFTGSQVAAIFAIDYRTVTDWIARKMLAGERALVGPGPAGHKPWIIKKADLKVFMQKHADAYDKERIDRARYHRWRDWAEACAPAIADGATRHGRKWTAKDDKFLLDNHAAMSMEELGQALGRTREAIHGRIELLRALGHQLAYKGLWEKRQSRRLASAAAEGEQALNEGPWTEEEDNFIRCNWGRLRTVEEMEALLSSGARLRGTRVTAAEIATSLHRTKFACESRASRLGVKNTGWAAPSAKAA